MGRPAEPFDEDAFREAWAASVKVRVMADQFGHSVSWVSNTAARLGLPPRPRGARPLRRSEQRDVTRKARVDAAALRGGDWVPNGRGVMVYR